MAHGHIWEFDPTKETVDDFCQRFEFYCLANKITDEDDQKEGPFHNNVGTDHVCLTTRFSQSSRHHYTDLDSSGRIAHGTLQAPDN